MSDHLIRAAKFTVLLAVAILVGIVVALGSALLGHEILVLAVGEDGIPAIDDTLPMFVLVAGTYIAGTVAGLLVFIAGRRRFLRRPRIHRKGEREGVRSPGVGEGHWESRDEPPFRRRRATSRTNPTAPTIAASSWGASETGHGLGGSPRNKTPG